MTIQDRLTHWDSLSYYDRDQLRAKYKPIILEKLSNIIGEDPVYISCTSPKTKRYLKKVYNADIQQTPGVRKLIMNGIVHETVKITSYNYTFAELLLVELACDKILAAPNFRSGIIEPPITTEEMTIQDHLYRVFRLKANFINSYITDRIEKEFKYTIKRNYHVIGETIELNIDIFHNNMLVHAMSQRFSLTEVSICYGRIKSKYLKPFTDKVWVHILQRLPNYEEPAKQKRWTDEEKLVAIKHILNSKSSDKLAKIQSIALQTYKPIIKDKL